MTLAIAQLGHPILRQKAEEIPIAEIGSDEFQCFLKDMHDTLIERSGAGLAGPQIFAARRIFLARVLPSADENELPGVEVFINPEIIATSEEMDFRWEGCLSFPELTVLVERHMQITVEFHDANGNRQTREYDGLAARVVQHEYDHLEGILTIDRAPSTYYIIKESELEAFMEHHEKSNP